MNNIISNITINKVYNLYLYLKYDYIYCNLYYKGKINSYKENIEIGNYYFSTFNVNIVKKVNEELYNTLYNKHIYFNHLIKTIENDINEIITYNIEEYIIKTNDNDFPKLYNLLYNYRVQLNNNNYDYVITFQRFLQEYNEYVSINSKKINELYNYNDEITINN